MRIYLKDGKNLMENIRKNFENFEFPCNGNGKCGKCKIILESGKINDLTKIEKENLKYEEIDKGIRLACKVEMESDIEIKLLDNYEEKVKKKENDNRAEIGILDIGTTTLEISLYDEKLELIKKLKRNNPQKKFGADILNRAHYAMRGQYEKENIKNILIKEIEELIPKNLKSLYVAGNSIMQHIFLGISTENLLKPPYDSEYNYLIKKNSLEIGFENSFEIEVMPIVGGFVGGDAFAVIYAYDKLYTKNEKVLLADIGTNGEIIIAVKDTYVAVSAAAGPAFEGASLECGMRAEEGALETITIENEVEYKTIGDKELRGICGSGVVKLMSELLYTGTLDKSGKLAEKNLYYPQLTKKITGNKFYINDKIYLSQKDIREIQYAKSAIRTAIDILLEEVNLNYENIDKVILTGNFGKNLDIKSIKKIGLLPDIKEEKILLKENMVLEGMYLYLKNGKKISEIDILKTKINHVEISKKSKFNDFFMKNMGF